MALSTSFSPLTLKLTAIADRIERSHPLTLVERQEERDREERGIYRDRTIPAPIQSAAVNILRSTRKSDDALLPERIVARQLRMLALSANGDLEQCDGVIRIARETALAMEDVLISILSYLQPTQEMERVAGVNRACCRLIKPPRPLVSPVLVHQIRESARHGSWGEGTLSAREICTYHRAGIAPASLFLIIGPLPMRIHFDDWTYEHPLSALQYVRLATTFCRNTASFHLLGGDDEQLRLITRGCSHLTHLELTSQHVTEGSFTILSAMRELRSLQLAPANAPSDAALRRLSTFPALRELHLDGLQSHCLTDETSEILLELPHLATLFLGYIDSISDATLTTLGRAAALTQLMISHCEGLRGEGLADPRRVAYRRLHMLHVWGCYALTPSGILNIVHVCQALLDFEVHYYYGHRNEDAVEEARTIVRARSPSPTSTTRTCG